jgi:hypothetical protein
MKKFIGKTFIFIFCITITLQSCNLKQSNSANTSDNAKQLNDAEKLMPYHFYDDFSNGNINNWNIGQFDNYSILITNNNLVIDNHSTDQAKGSFHSFNIDTNKDFIIETAAIKMVGDSDNGYGIVWGSNDGYNFYCFLIDNINMKYSIDEINGGEEINIKDWTKSDAIKQIGENKLTIQKHNNSLNFYINDNLVYDGAFSAFFGNQIGMMAEPDIILNERKVAFKYFKVSGTQL